MTARAIRAPRGQLGLTGALVGAAVLAWAASAELMAGMDAGPWAGIAALGTFTLAWVAMMAAMMLPSALPAVLLFDRVQQRRRGPGSSWALAANTASFVAGYLVPWTLLGLAVHWVLGLLRPLDLAAWEGAGHWVAAAVLVVAAGHGLTPLKDACLAHCRTPLEFMSQSWREGRLGAARMGARHGAWCVACCWALMAALIALGMMSLVWMAVIAVLVALEKNLPSVRAAKVSVTVVLVALGVGAAAAPDQVLGLGTVVR